VPIEEEDEEEEEEEEEEELHVDKCFHFINSVTLTYIRRKVLRMLHKHRNTQKYFKKQILLICIY
jgi:hypothetical protein